MLDGSLVALRAPIDTDRTALQTWRNDLRLQAQLLALPRANSAERVYEWLNRMQSDPAAVFFVIAAKPDNRPIGYIQIVRLDHIHGTGDLGICVANEAQGKGLAAEALNLLERYLYQVFGLRKILLQVRADNARAIGFYTKSGYALAGTLKRHHYHDATYHDVAIFEKFLS